MASTGSRLLPAVSGSSGARCSSVGILALATVRQGMQGRKAGVLWRYCCWPPAPQIGTLASLQASQKAHRARML